MKKILGGLSFGEIISKVMADRKMRPPERMLMFELILMAFDIGNSDIRITRAELAGKLDREKRSVTRSLSSLIRKGWLLRLERPGEQSPILRVRILNPRDT